MLSNPVKRPLAFVLVGIMLLTFCSSTPRADAAVILLVPAVVVGCVAAVGGIGVAIKNIMKSADEKKTTRKEKPPEQNEAGALKPALAEPVHAQG